MKTYILEAEDVPYRTTKHKNHLPKLMDICLLARPRFDPETGEWWDGKLGIWMFAEEVAAKRSSRNRPRGTIELKGISVTKDIYKQYLRTHLIPAILSNWPRKRDLDGQLIDEYLFLQQDNARTHVTQDKFDEIWSEFNDTQGIHLELAKQPPNSPDLNILDLAFFCSLQTYYFKDPGLNLMELKAKVEQAYWAYPREKNRKIVCYVAGCHEQDHRRFGWQ